MLYSGIFFFILTLVLSEKKILNGTKNHNPPPLQVKWSVPNQFVYSTSICRFKIKQCIMLCIVLNFQYTRVTIPIKNNIFANVICNIYKKGVKGITYIFSVVHNLIIFY